MVHSDREQRLAFLRLTDPEITLLRALQPVFEQHAHEIEDGFYNHLLQWPETAGLLRDHSTVERLKKLQHDYLASITAGVFGTEYFENRLMMGRTHERVGLLPKWYLLSYSYYYQLLAGIIREHYREDTDRAEDSLLALHKVFMLDASLAMEAYIASDRYRHLQQLESIVRDSADVIFSLDEEDRLRSWNRAAERVFGWTSAEILGKHFSILVPQDLIRDGELARIHEKIQAEGSYHFESIRLAKDGRRVPVEVTVSQLCDPQGRPIGRSAILRDITERRKLQEENLRAERLAVIGTMSARLAHEIRNPLSSITLNIDLVHDEIESLCKTDPATGTEARALLKSLNTEVRRVQRVTEDYLKFARMPKPHREPIALNDVLDQQLAFMESLFEATHVTLVRHFDPDLPQILADENQLWQAVLNLIRNALEAMPQGGTLTVRTERALGHILLIISDTGKGIATADRQHLFKPFFSTKVGGTGLGLPLTQQIITEHAGTIRCDSTPDLGTTFVIELPHY